MKGPVISGGGQNQHASSYFEDGEYDNWHLIHGILSFLAQTCNMEKSW